MTQRHGRGQADCTKGEYASWRATRASGDFDLRTFSIRIPRPAGARTATGDERLSGGHGNEAGVETGFLLVARRGANGCFTIVWRCF
jgi:hypothetical protein